MSYRVSELMYRCIALALNLVHNVPKLSSAVQCGVHHLQQIVVDTCTHTLHCYDQVNFFPSDKDMKLDKSKSNCELHQHDEA